MITIKPRSLFVFLTSILSACSNTTANAESWRSELYPADWTPPQYRNDLNFLTDEFVQDFSYAGYHRGEKPIPNPAGPIFNVVDNGADPSGVQDSTAAIQSTIDAAGDANGGVVFLPAGTYLLAKPDNQSYCLRITHSNIVLRGAGWDQTFLVNTTTSMRSSSVIKTGTINSATWESVTSTPILIARDYPGPTMEIELSGWRSFKVGDWIVVHNPFTDSIQPEGSFVQDIKMDGSNGKTLNWLGLGNELDGPMMYRQITAVDESKKTIFIDAPTRWYLLKRDGARVYSTYDLLEEVGLEDFSIGNLRHPATEKMGESDYSNTSRAAYELHSSALLTLERMRNSWIRNVRSFNPGNDNGVHMLSNGLVVNWCRGLTIQAIEMQNAQYGGGGGNGYMIRLNASNESLIRNSHVAYCRHGIVMWRMQNSGNVMLKNLDENCGVQMGNDGSLQATSGKGSDHHGLFSHSNLFDRHVLNKSFAEAAFRGSSGSTVKHSQSSSQSLYWNSEGIGYFHGRSYIIRSDQGGHGYIIGTQGPAAKASNASNSSSYGAYTTPVDHVEGVDRGASLQPASLYTDQLARRRKRDDLALEVSHPPLLPEISLDTAKKTLQFRISSQFGLSYQLIRSFDLENNNLAWTPLGSPLSGNGKTLEWPTIILPSQSPLFLSVQTLP